MIREVSLFIVFTGESFSINAANLMQTSILPENRNRKKIKSIEFCIKFTSTSLKRMVQIKQYSDEINNKRACLRLSCDYKMFLQKF